MKVGDYSPWGKIQHVAVVTEGIDRISTASHGGYKLDRKRNALMPKVLRNEGGWYEEDCQCAKVHVVFNMYFKVPMEDAKKSLANWYPDEYEEYFGVTLGEGESLEKDERLFYERHKNDWVVIAAMGSWHEDCPQGYTLVVASKGGQRSLPCGDEQRFLVPEKEYKERGRFFVIDLARHKPVDYLSNVV